MLLSCLQDTTQLILSAMVIGTTSVVLTGILAALKLSGGTLVNHKFLFLGARESETGIAKLMALEMLKQTMSIL